MQGFLFALALAMQAWTATADIPPKYLGKHPNPEDVVGRINGQEIKAKDVEDLLWQWRGNEVTIDILDYLVVKQEADRIKINVTEAEIQERLSQRIKQYAANLPAGLTAEEALLSQGFGESRLYLRVKRELMLEKMALRDFRAQDYVKVATITYPLKSEQVADVGNAIQKATQAYDKLIKGSKWEDVLGESTSNPDIIKTKGLVGWRLLKIFPVSVGDELRTLPVGGVSKPAQTQAGIQIFRVEAKGSTATPQEVTELRTSYLGGAMQQLEKKLREAAKMEPYKPGKKL